MLICFLLTQQRVYFLSSKNFLMYYLKKIFLQIRIQVKKFVLRFRDCSVKSLLSTSKKVLIKILNLSFQEITMIQLVLLTINFRQLVFLDYYKQKSIVLKAYHIHLLKILPFLSLLWLFNSFECSDDCYKNVQSKDVRN